MERGRYAQGTPRPGSPGGPAAPLPWPYPPPQPPSAHDPYGPPPGEPARTSSLWAGFGVFLVSMSLVAVAVASLPLYIYLMGRNHGATPPPPAFTDPFVVGVIQKACARLTDDLASLPRAPSDASPATVRRIVRAEAAAIERFVARVRDDGGERLLLDKPGPSYLGHWTGITWARETYAAQLVAGHPSPEYVLPVDSDGNVVTERIEHAAPCDVPDRLVEPPRQPFVETTRYAS